MHSTINPANSPKGEKLTQRISHSLALLHLGDSFSAGELSGAALNIYASLGHKQAKAKAKTA